MSSDGSDSPPAEQIEDKEIMRRVLAELEYAETPFLTTTDINERLDEIKLDQVRIRLKKLRDENELASTKQQGYLWWVPEDGELAGKVDPLSSQEREPDWDSVDVEDIPRHLREKVAEQVDLSDDPSLWKQTYDGAFVFVQIGVMIFAPGMALLLFDSSRFLPSLPGWLDELGAFLFGIGIMVAMAGGLVMGLMVILEGLSRKGEITKYPFGFGEENQPEE